MLCNQVRAPKVSSQVIVLTLTIILVTTYYNIRFVARRTPSLYDKVYNSATDFNVKPETRPPNADPIEQQETLQSRLPQCLIIGEMKCGTRALLEYMGLHPDIAIAKDEVNFFDSHFNKGLDWYRDQMPLSTPGQITVEKTPSYYRRPECIEHIRSMNASIKVILLVRDPVDRSVSDWIEICRQLREANDESFQRICQTYESSGVLTSTGEVNPNSKFIRRSIYSRYINIWTRWFPVGAQLLVIDGDKFVSDPLSELVRVESFLGLRNYLTKDNFVFNEKKGFYCKVSESGHRRCLSKTKGASHPDLNPEVAAKLRKFFEPLNRRFYEAVQHDFGWP